MLPHVSAQAETTENLIVGAACSAPDLVGSWRTSSRCCGTTGGWGCQRGNHIVSSCTQNCAILTRQDCGTVATVLLNPSANRLLGRE
jgi:hypothetical protein